MTMTMVRDANKCVRFLVGDDQVGCLIDKGGNIIETMRSDSGTEIGIRTNHHLLLCVAATYNFI